MTFYYLTHKISFIINNFLSYIDDKAAGTLIKNKEYQGKL